MSKSGKNFLWGAVIGTVAGSVTALLLAPKPGKELRQDIAEGARVAAEKTQAAAGKAREQSKEFYSRIKTAAGNLADDVSSRLGKEKPLAEEVTEELTEELTQEVTVSSESDSNSNSEQSL